jgi:hypothetical protein
MILSKLGILSTENNIKNENNHPRRIFLGKRPKPRSKTAKQNSLKNIAQKAFEYLKSTLHLIPLPMLFLYWKMMSCTMQESVRRSRVMA